jgi:phage tail sheath protein FI
MSEYLAPGVFVEEVSFRSKSIEGVGTSVCGMVGPTRFGPVRGTPEVVTSYSEFEKVFGDPAPLKFKTDTSDIAVPNYSALAARAFFENSGKQLYFTRILAGGNDTNAYGTGGSAAVAKAVAAGSNISFEARYPGSGGDLDVQIIWQDQENLFRSRSYVNFDLIPMGAEGVITTKAIAEGDFIGDPTFASDKFPLKQLTALVKKTAAGFEFLSDSKKEIVDTADAAATLTDTLSTGIKKASLATLAFEFKQVWINTPAGGAAATGSDFELVLNSALDVTRFITPEPINNKLLRGTLNEGSLSLKVLAKGAAPDTQELKDIPLAVFAAFPSSVKSLKLQRDFSLIAIRRKKTLKEPDGKIGMGETVYASPLLSLDEDETNFIGRVLQRDPQKKVDQLTLPLVSHATPGTSAADLFKDLYKLFNTGALNPTDLLEEPRYIIALTGGSDGEFPLALDYAGESDEQGPTGFAALENVEDVSIVATPSAVIDPSQHQAIAVEMEKHCVKMRYRFGLIDSPQDASLGEIQAFRDNFDNSRLALYAPWVIVSDPTGAQDSIAVPPSGFIAGIYARTDVDRGVHKAPANTPVLGALRFSQDINKFQQELLNPKGINALRSFSGRGHQVWGGRTLSSDPEWKYVNVRRYFLYLERSIEKSTQWAVFEPNGERLWANLVTTVESFLFNEWKNGRLLGAQPAAAYFVRCDRSTMSQNDLDNGRLVCEVGVAALTPAEFVVFRIGQKTADA